MAWTFTSSEKWPNSIKLRTFTTKLRYRFDRKRMDAPVGAPNQNAFTSRSTVITYS